MNQGRRSRRIAAPFAHVLLLGAAVACGQREPPAEVGSPAESVPTAAVTPATAVTPVTVMTFARAESHRYFAATVATGGLGRLYHERAPVAIDAQTVIRMNRDTLYSSGVFDLDAGPVSIELPDVGTRFMSLLLIDEDHYAQPVVYAPGSYTVTREQIGTRYVMAAVRTLVDPADAADVSEANRAQDGIRVSQASVGSFEIPNWDAESLDRIRNSLLALAADSGATTEERFGLRSEVDPILHLLFTAAGWGGNPREAAVYTFADPAAQDGAIQYRIDVRDVPVDGFWSISVYNADGFFERNDLDSYSLNNLTATPNADGSFSIQLGGCTRTSVNCLVTPPEWSYVVRMYRPREPILSGAWQFPEAVPVR